MFLKFCKSLGEKILTRFNKHIFSQQYITTIIIHVITRKLNHKNHNMLDLTHDSSCFNC